MEDVTFEQLFDLGTKFVAVLGGFGASLVAIRFLMMWVKDLNGGLTTDNTRLLARVSQLESHMVTVQEEARKCQEDNLILKRQLNDLEIAKAIEVYDLKVKYAALRSHIVRLYPEFRFQLEQEEKERHDADRIDPRS